MKSLIKNYFKTAFIASAVLFGTAYNSFSEESSNTETNRPVLEQRFIFYNQEGKEQENSLTEKVKKPTSRVNGNYYSPSYSTTPAEQKPVQKYESPKLGSKIETKIKPIARTEPSWCLEDIFGLSFGMELGLGGGRLNAKKVPREYQDIPVNPGDHYVNSQTARLDIEGQRCSIGNAYAGLNTGIPIKVLDFLRFGYKINWILPIKSSGDFSTRTPAIEDRKDYSYGAWALTYSKIEVPTVIHSFYGSTDFLIPMKNNGFFLLRAGLSYDLASTKIEGGWDRYSNDEAYIGDKLDLAGINPFFSIGMGEEDSNQTDLLEISYQSLNMKSQTSHGDVELGGTLIRIGYKNQF